MQTCCIYINYDMYIHHIQIYIYLYDLIVSLKLLSYLSNKTYLNYL